MSDALTSDSRLRFPNYEILGTLGRGAMGVVHLAKDLRIGRRVALKAVEYDASRFDDAEAAEEYFSRLQREAELCGMLQHTNIVTLYEAGVSGNAITFLAFEYVEGESLQQIIRAKKRLPVEEALSYGEGILRALVYAHSRGVIHRDIKPANILVSNDGEAKLADFGIARPQGSNLTIDGSLLGTPNYMSPEQVAGGGVSEASDLFSFGVLFYEMLTGVKPFAAPEVNAILYNVAHVEAAPPSRFRPELDAKFDAFVARLMAKKPSARYQSASEALAVLHQLRGLPESAEAEAPAQVSVSEPLFVERRPAGEIPVPIALLIVAAVVLPILAWGWRVSAELRKPIDEAAVKAQVVQLEAKKAELARAAALLQAGKKDEGVAAYRAYLQKHPASVVARQRLDEAERPEVVVAEKDEAPPRASADRAPGNPPPGGVKRGWNQLRRKVRKIFD